MSRTIWAAASLLAFTATGLGFAAAPSNAAAPVAMTPAPNQTVATAEALAIISGDTLIGAAAGGITGAVIGTIACAPTIGLACPVTVPVGFAAGAAAGAAVGFGIGTATALMLPAPVQ
ncbi:hypothetical protein [Nocardia wallacei]|uniref:hypothetical protein n=1 Tax=Nocardia wallacei TaxID=480035 RepID=UPI002457246F|nr:hypothetical protein [Nocardia wallacei]